MKELTIIFNKIAKFWKYSPKRKSYILVIYTQWNMLCFGTAVFWKITLYYKYLFTPLKYLKQFHFHCIMNIILQKQQTYVCVSIYLYYTLSNHLSFSSFLGPVSHLCSVGYKTEDLTWESQGCRTIRSFCLDLVSRKY